ncbi:NUDIX hydrolase [Shouchella lonarensis]|uniref:8-oxo-dGTP diphosphatase n=1 Tax=Shouchella lonarensis TaxID=1464122 RepID=A0A1G6MJA2_9BACI|nr:NUDIX domain-containing protein [Shouchella lonarensis]SDC55560.1 8-oxo-dGTP diphosphatase [Shouchella lonarensis]
MKVFGEQRPDLNYRKRQGVYAVVIDAETKKCMTVQTERGHFLPGGGIEAGESLQDCLKREMLEETGYEVEAGTFIGKAQQYFLSPQNEPLLSEASFYAVKLLDKVQEPTEVDHTVTWIDLDYLEGYLYHAHHEWAVRKAV